MPFNTYELLELGDELNSCDMRNNANNFIYFIDLTDPLVCFNLSITNQLTSSAIAHFETFKTEYPLYTIDPEQLLTNLNSNQIGFVSPRFKFITLSHWRRNGVIIGEGIENRKFYNASEIDRIHRIARLEIDFEIVRRKVNPSLPSRLSCIYVAEDNFDGRVMLQNMFYYKTKFHIAPVEIYAIRIHKADSKWISDYEEYQKTEAIENYWSGIDFDKNPQYEYLVEGIIKLKNVENREIIKSKFDSTPYYT